MLPLQERAKKRKKVSLKERNGRIGKTAVGEQSEENDHKVVLGKAQRFVARPCDPLLMPLVEIKSFGCCKFTAHLALSSRFSH